MHHKKIRVSSSLWREVASPPSVTSVNELLCALCCVRCLERDFELLLSLPFMLPAVTAPSQDPSPCVEIRTKPETSFFLTPNTPLF